MLVTFSWKIHKNIWRKWQIFRSRHFWQKLCLDKIPTAGFAKLLLSFWTVFLSVPLSKVPITSTSLRFQMFRSLSNFCRRSNRFGEQTLQDIGKFLTVKWNSLRSFNRLWPHYFRRFRRNLHVIGDKSHVQENWAATVARTGLSILVRLLLPITFAPRHAFEDSITWNTITAFTWHLVIVTFSIVAIRTM